MDSTFVTIPHYVIRAMSDRGATLREVYVLMALMRHRPNEAGEIGISPTGYVLSSQDVCDYVGMTSPNAVRTAIVGLRKKGLIELSRHVVKNGKRMAVYRLTVHDEDGDDHTENAGTCTSGDAHKCPTCTSDDAHTCIATDAQCASQMMHTRRSTEEVTNEDLGLRTDIPTSYSNSLNAVSRNRSPTSVSTRGFRSNPIHPYPASPDEVYDFSESDPHIDGCLPYEDAERFFWKNQSQGWRYPDGSAIVDWHHALRRYSDGIIDNLTRKEARDEGVDRYAEYD